MPRRRMGRRAAAAVKGTALTGGVHVSACLQRDGEVKGEFYSTMTKLFLDKDGNLMASASCGDDAFVCRKDELKQVAKFISEIAEAK